MTTSPAMVCHRGGRFAAALTVLVAAVGLVISAPPADAGETDTFRLQPYPLEVGGDVRRAFQLSVEPGATVTDAVELTNLTDQPRRFRLYPADASTDPQTGATAVTAAGASLKGVGSWIDVERSDVAVAPGARELVSFSVARPAGTAATGTGAVVAEEVREAATGPGIDVVFRVAILVDLSGKAASLTVDAPNLTVPVALLPSSGTVGTTLHNETLQPVTSTVHFAVHSLTGRSWALQPVTVELAPGERLRVEQDWEAVPRWGGVLRASAEATWSGGAISAQGPRALHPPPWLLAVVILALAVRVARELPIRVLPGRPAVQRTW
ncbi:MAG: DUF916 domain-containing protein [Actinobacteria bacterium]|nr:DUF916 domain-containing protein [Actinomycetota bacterium]